MKRTVLLGILIGFILTLISLIKSSGLTPPMVPCAGIGPGCVAGVVVNTPVANTGHRGFPLPILYLQKDDSENEVYEGYSAIGILGNLVLYTSLATFIIIGVRRIRTN